MESVLLKLLDIVIFIFDDTVNVNMHSKWITTKQSKLFVNNWTWITWADYILYRSVFLMN